MLASGAATSPTALARLRTSAVNVYGLGQTLDVCLLGDLRDERMEESLAAVEGELRRIVDALTADDPAMRPSAAAAAAWLEAPLHREQYGGGPPGRLKVKSIQPGLGKAPGGALPGGDGCGVR